MDLVNAQQARRVLDRMVGYTISPLFVGEIKTGFKCRKSSVGCLRIICDREQEINAFHSGGILELGGRVCLGGEKKPLNIKIYGEVK